MGTIITISGPSGSGKTTLADHLLSLGSQYRIIKSVTTRHRRERDRPDEFLYLTHEEFNKMEHEDKFLWVTPPIHGTRYGTLRESIKRALIDPGVSVMIITIECLPLLRVYVARDEQKIEGLYVLSPSEEVLRVRMSMRGDDAQEIEKRINECWDWDTRAIKLNEIVPVNFIHNSGTLDEFFTEAQQRIRL